MSCNILRRSNCAYKLSDLVRTFRGHAQYSAIADEDASQQPMSRRGFHLKSIHLAFSKQHKMSEAINGLAAATDVCIAALLVFLLNRSRTGFKGTNSLINTLMVGPKMLFLNEAR